MRFLIDANLSPKIANLLKDKGHDAVHVLDINFHKATDQEIIELAVSEDRVIITSDHDFSRILSQSKAIRPSLIFIKGMNHRRAISQVEILLANFEAIQNALMSGAIVVIDSGLLRTRSLPIE